MLIARAVEKSYGDVVALRGVDLDVEAGQIVSLLGRNGAGKTSLLSIIAGLRQPDAGSITVAGVDAVANPVQAARHMGIAPQETGVYRVLTVRENLDFFGELAGLGKTARSRRTNEVAEQLGMAELLERRADKLSGGEVRRLHTGCALVHTPELLMLDEPTVGADVATRLQLIEAVRDLAKAGAAVVYTTHYLPEVEALAADIVIIDDGQILARGTQTALMAEHELHGLVFEVDDADAFDATAIADMAPEHLGDGRFRVTGNFGMQDLLGRLGPQSGCVVSVEALRADLEGVFLKVTGSALDDDAGAQADVAGESP